MFVYFSECYIINKNNNWCRASADDDCVIDGPVSLTFFYFVRFTDATENFIKKKRTCV